MAGAHIVDASNRAVVRLEDGRTGIITYCPSRKARRDGRGSRPSLTTVIVAGAHVHVAPAALTVEWPRPGDRCRIMSPAGELLEGTFVRSDLTALILEDDAGCPSSYPRRMITDVEVLR